MRWQKGVVMESTGKQVVVLTPQGEFKRIRVKGRTPDIGEEIRVPVQNGMFSGFPKARWLAVAAAVLLFMIASPLLTIMTQPPEVAVAYVAIDINPSIELTVSNRNNVLAVKAYNRDGAKVLAGLDIKGSNYKKAVSEIGKKAIALGFISKDGGNTFVISLSQIPNAKFDKAAMERTLLASANEVLADSSVTGQVKTIQVPAELRDRATQKGISSAKYAVLLEAVTSGLSVTEKDMQEKSIEVAIASAGGEPDQIINRAHKEDKFEDTEEKYFEILRHRSTIAMEQNNEDEVSPSGISGNETYNTISEEQTTDEVKQNKGRKSLIEIVRKAGNPEEPKEGNSGSNKNNGNSASVINSPQIPASELPIDTNPTGQNPGPANATGSPVDSGSNVGSPIQDEVDETVDDENTEENYMGTPVNRDTTHDGGQDMSRLKPNF